MAWRASRPDPTCHPPPESRYSGSVHGRCQCLGPPPRAANQEHAAVTRGALGPARPCSGTADLDPGPAARSGACGLRRSRGQEAGAPAVASRARIDPAPSSCSTSGFRCQSPAGPRLSLLQSRAQTAPRSGSSSPTPGDAQQCRRTPPPGSCNSQGSRSLP
jgi:hypothetical protein